MWTPSKPKATKDTEENSHSDDEDETPQYQKTDDKDDMIEELKLRVKDKEKEIRRLRRLNLQLQEGLADTITQTVKDAIQATKPVPSHQAPLPNQSAEIKNESVTALMNPTAMEYAQRCEGYKKLTRTVMDSIFTVEEMTTCSVTGKKGIVGEKRQSLDKGKVKLVIDHVKKVHRGIGDTEIKACMAQKLKDTRRRAERETWSPAAENQED
ncbi:uncharacterized protein LOC123964638 isoform X2 [Micropterus dolomieu]|uniref:uncharacterized protein LOC123964638 isoform X2 n=1 Tax=Micropterus dolomieu TaxID=147949 RepID=UPI001E8EC4A3|nr:uncharacterized protein LOC123964638 isoform X2 [Micropterus dolomieu]